MSASFAGGADGGEVFADAGDFFDLITKEGSTTCSLEERI